MAELRVKSTGTLKLFESDNTSSVTIASPASLGADRTITLPDASVTLASGTMLATDGSGASLTALNASELGSGTVPTARLGSGTASSSVFLAGDSSWTAPGGGITEIDHWRLTSSLSLSSFTAITANLERVDGPLTHTGNLGTGMTESSGTFTFPSTGWWEVAWQFYFSDTANNRDMVSYMYITDDDFSSQSSVGYQIASINVTDNAGSHGQQISRAAILDIQDVSNDKVKFTAYSPIGTTVVPGSSTQSRTLFRFIKFADT